MAATVGCEQRDLTYRDRRTADLAARKRVKALSGVERAAWLKLDRIEAVQTLMDLAALHGNRFASGDDGRYRIQVDDAWWICFEWPENGSGPTNLEIVDYDSGEPPTPTAIHPGEHLAEELGILKMTASELARRLKVPTNRITAILNGQRGITGDTALRLAHFFGTTGQFWLNLQSAYDLRVADAKAGGVIKELPRLKREEIAVRHATIHAKAAPRTRRRR